MTGGGSGGRESGRERTACAKSGRQGSSSSWRNARKVGVMDSACYEGTGWGEGGQDGGMERRDGVHFTGEKTEAQVTYPRSGSCLQQGAWIPIGPVGSKVYSRINCDSDEKSRGGGRGLLNLHVCVSQCPLSAALLCPMSGPLPLSPGRKIFPWNFRECLWDLLAMERGRQDPARPKLGRPMMMAGGEQGGLLWPDPA